jgi:hypothetical protein
VTLPGYFAIAFGCIAILWNVYSAVLHRKEGRGKLGERVSAIEASRLVTCAEHSKQLDLLPEIKRSIDLLVYRHDLEDRMVLRDAAAAIHSPHESGPGGRDELMDKLRDGQLTDPGELCTLWRMLRQYLDETTDPLNRWYASQAMTRVRWELHKHRVERRTARLGRFCGQDSPRR